MKISYIGNAAFKLSARAQASASSPRETVIIVTDPYAKTIGLSFPSMEADVVLISHDDDAHNTIDKIKGEPFIITEPGEFERSGVGIEGFPIVVGDKNSYRTSYIISVEGLRTVFLGGFTAKELSSDQLDVIGLADILLVPVGGDDAMNAKEAANVINQIEPRVVIPMQYKLKGMKKTKATDVSVFLKEMGGSAETIETLTATASSLPQDETKIIVLAARGEK